MGEGKAKVWDWMGSIPCVMYCILMLFSLVNRYRYAAHPIPGLCSTARRRLYLHTTTHTEESTAQELHIAGTVHVAQHRKVFPQRGNHT